MKIVPTVSTVSTCEAVIAWCYNHLRWYFYQCRPLFTLKIHCSAILFGQNLLAIFLTYNLRILWQMPNVQSFLWHFRWSWALSRRWLAKSGQIMRTNMLSLIFAFLHKNKLLHVKTNLCNGSQIVMRKSFGHEFSTWTYGILLFKKEVALKVFIWEK